MTDARDHARGGEPGATGEPGADGRGSPWRWTFDADVWRWAAREDTWLFVAMPTELADDVRDAAITPPRGFGSIHVEVELGSSTWRTSIFPDASRGTFVLPLKGAVRRREGVVEGDIVRVVLSIAT